MESRFCKMMIVLVPIAMFSQVTVTSFQAAVHTPRCRIMTTSTQLDGWQDKMQELFGGLATTTSRESSPAVVVLSTNDETGVGTVVRLSARKFDSESSTPSSRTYTTRKEQVESMQITSDGVSGDYNHYRTVALKSTPDRAVSLLTTDVMEALQANFPKYQVQDGDLGENILVEGVSFNFFQVGERYEFLTPPIPDEPAASSNSVIIEITEKMEPCVNLCKLPYINNDAFPPAERIANCKSLIQFLDRYEGYRGWYAKVVREGTISSGTTVSIVRDN